jgi:hypothetical protein
LSGLLTVERRLLAEGSSTDRSLLHAKYSSLSRSQRPVDHSSWVSAQRAPTSREVESTFGKIRSVYLPPVDLLDKAFEHVGPPEPLAVLLGHGLCGSRVIEC